ncbi:hypothetical protein [Arthrobacter sp. AD-310]
MPDIRRIEDEDGRYVRHRRNLRIRRLIGVTIILTALWGAIWLCFLSGLADPLIAVAAPAFNAAAALINNPLGVDWGGWLVGAAAIIIPHIALLLFLFDDSTR